MTIMPMYKICSKCRKRYFWNPDVGRFCCPDCGGLGKPGKLLEKILAAKKKEEVD